VVAPGGNEADQRSGRNGHSNDAMTARLIVSVHDRRGNRASGAAEPGTD
jgi:hypothetical protein